MQTILSVLFYVPGAAELFTFVTIFIILALLRKAITWDLVPRSVLLTCAIFIALGVFSSNGPLYYVMIGFIAFVSLMARKSPEKYEKTVLPVTLFVYFACYMLFTSVDHPVIVPATWNIGEKGKIEDGRPPEQLVEFHYGGKGQQTQGIYSDELAAYLKTLALDKVEITIDALYHWGKLAGTSLEKVNGKKFDSQSGFAGCIDDCKDTPYPKIFLGIRSKF